MALTKTWTSQRAPAHERLAGDVDPVDAHVGARIRLRRMALGISQSSLADHLGLTFQQIQKYESGGNRVSASKLYRAACFMSCPVSYFFDGLSIPEGEQANAAHRRAEMILSTFLARPEGLELAMEFPNIRSRGVRQQIVRLVRQIAADSAIQHQEDRRNPD